MFIAFTKGLKVVCWDSDDYRKKEGVKFFYYTVKQ